MASIIRSRNIINTVWNVADTIMYPALFFAFTPFFLRHLGDEQFGIYTLASQAVVYIQVLNFGLGTATFINVARNKAVNDGTRSAQTINTNLSFLLMVFVLSIIIGAIVFALTKFGNLYRIDEHLKTIAAISIMLGIMVGALKAMEQIPLNGLKGLERFDTASAINIFFRVSVLVVNVVLVYMNFSVQYMWVTASVLALCGLLLLVLTLKRRLPEFTPSLHIDFKKIKEELSLGVWLWLQTVLVVFAYRLDVSLVPYLDNGLTKVTYYGLVETIFNHIHMVFIAGALWVFPRFTALAKQGKDVVPLYRTTRSFIIVGSLLALCIFSVLKQPLFTLWVGAERYEKFNEFLPWFTGFEMFYVATIIPFLFLNSTGNEKGAFTVNLLVCGTTLLCVLGGFLLVKTPQGLIWGLITGTVITVPYVGYYLNKYLLKGKWLHEVIATLIPSAFAFAFTVTGIVWLKGVLFLFFLISCKLIFLNRKNFDYKLLLN